MKGWTLQTGRTNARLQSAKAHSNVDIEMVTDDMALVMITVDISGDRVANAAWVFALAVDAFALFLEEEAGAPFRFFTVTFDGAWEMVNARATNRRKKSAELPTLPLFLGGTSVPPEE